MEAPRVVLDTNVLISAFRSRRGPAFALVSRIGSGSFEISISVPLVFEYEEVLHRATSLEDLEVLSVLRFLCSVAHRQKIFYLWRPLLPDPKDDMVLELAVASRSRFIVTYNQRDFLPADRFGIESLKPEELLRRIGA
jgi:putative PIN family toxin of toxin-antitoxin system